MTLIVYIHADEVDAYTGQGWQCTRLLAHHGARTYGRNFMAVITW